jgi:hypothetical protein
VEHLRVEAYNRCPSTEKWIKKICHIYIMEYYSAINKNVIILFARKWMELEIIMLSEVRMKKTNITFFLQMQNLVLKKKSVMSAKWGHCLGWEPAGGRAQQERLKVGNGHDQDTSDTCRGQKTKPIKISIKERVIEE